MAQDRPLKELAQILGGRAEGNPSEPIRDVAPFEGAGPGDVTFAADKKLLRSVPSCNASAIIVGEKDFPSVAVTGKNFIVVKNPQLAFAKAMEILRPQPLPAAGISPKAEVSPKAAIGKDVSIQPFVVIEDGAVIGDRAVLFPGVYIGKGASVGTDALLYSGVAVREGCVVGKRVIIHCNSVVGSDGFGYAKDGAKYVKIPQRGIVRIEDDAEIGACVTIDRATIGETVVGRGTKIDNLVQIAHNVKVGEDTIIVAQAGIAGSSKIGNRVQVAGQVGIVGHIEVGDDSALGAKTGVAQDIPPRTVYSGIPAIPHMDWLRASAVYSRLPELKKKVDELEKRLSKIEIPEE